MKIMAGIYLLIQSIWDIRTKKIPLWVTLCFAGCSLLYSIGCNRDYLEYVYGFIPGLTCFLLGYCTKESIGYGDAALLCALGLLYSFENIVVMCMTAVILAGIVGLILLVVFRKNGKYEIPFVPFLWMGWLFLFVGEVSGGILL